MLFFCAIYRNLIFIFTASGTENKRIRRQMKSIGYKFPLATNKSAKTCWCLKQKGGQYDKNVISQYLLSKTEVLA